jgi:hypothetical protein
MYSPLCLQGLQSGELQSAELQSAVRVKMRQSGMRYWGTGGILAGVIIWLVGQLLCLHWPDWPPAGVLTLPGQSPCSVGWQSPH